MATDTRVEFGVLGPLLVRRGAVLLPIPPGKQRALLAALLLAANQIVSQDALIDILWDADPPPSALVSLQNHVKRLRISLADSGRDRIRTERRGYLIRVLTGELDMAEFEDLVRAGRVAARADDWRTAASRFGQAVSLWRGEPLAGVCADMLVQREVPRLTELRLQALEGRIDAEMHLGLHCEVIAELRRLAAANPLRERLVQHLMLALHRDGQRAEALATYRAARRTLLDELGIEPGAELQHLHRQLLAEGTFSDPMGRQAMKVLSVAIARPWRRQSVRWRGAAGIPAPRARCHDSRAAAGQLRPRHQGRPPRLTMNLAHADRAGAVRCRSDRPELSDARLAGG